MSVARLSLHADPNDVRVARDFCGAELTRRFARSDGDVAFEDLVDDAQMVTSELVTNAVRARADVIELSIDTDATTLRIAVRDDAGGEVAIASPQPLQTSGRGLRIVADLAIRWGVDEHPTGKTVWAVLDLGPIAAPPVPPATPPRAENTARP